MYLKTARYWSGVTEEHYTSRVAGAVVDLADILIWCKLDPHNTWPTLSDRNNMTLGIH